MKFPRAHSCIWPVGAAALPAVPRISGRKPIVSAVRIVVGFAAGGLRIQARLMGQWLSDRLGQQFFIENRPAPAATSEPRRSPKRPRMATHCCKL